MIKIDKTYQVPAQATNKKLENKKESSLPSFC